MRWIKIVFLTFFVCCSLSMTLAKAQNCDSIKSGLGANAKVQNKNRDIVGQSLDTIMERGFMMFGVYDNFAPYSFMSEGKLTGIDIDLGRLIAQDIGVEARFYATAAGENVDADLRFNVWKGHPISGPISNVMLRIPYNRELACRNEQVVLNGQYYNERLAIAYREDAYPEEKPVPAYFRFDPVGVENDSISDFYLAGLAHGQINAKMSRFTSTLDAMEALQQGKVKAVMGPLAQLEYFVHANQTSENKDAIGIHIPPFPGLANSQWTLGTAVRHNWRPLSYRVDDAIIAAVQDGRMQDIFAKYGLTYTPPKW